MGGCVIQFIYMLYSVNFGGGKPRTTGGLLNFTVHILTMSHDIAKESKQTGICQKFLMGNLPNFSSAKHSRYTVSPK